MSRMSSLLSLLPSRIPTAVLLALVGAGCGARLRESEPTAEVPLAGVLPNSASRPQSRPPGDPLPLFGGTLLVTSDAKLAVGLWPADGLVQLVGLADTATVTDVQLPPGAEPRQAAELKSGELVVITDGSDGALYTITRSGRLHARQRVCTAPRGLAVHQQDGREVVSVACAGDELVTVDVPGLRPLAVQYLPAGCNARDVINQNNDLWLSCAQGSRVLKLPAGRLTDDQPLIPNGYIKQVNGPRIQITYQPTRGRRLIADGQGGALFLLQQGAIIIPPAPGYSPECADPPDCVSDLTFLGLIGKGFAMQRGKALNYAPNATDVALSRDGKTVLLLAAGNAASPLTGKSELGASTLQYRSLAQLDAPSHFSDLNDPDGHAVDALAVAATHDSEFAVLAEQPRRLILTTPDPWSWRVIPLGHNAETSHLGSRLFNTAFSKGLACASCHVEGEDDGNVLLRQDSITKMQIKRRTKYLPSALGQRSNYHWDGEFPNLPALIVGELALMGKTKVDPQSAPVTELAQWLRNLPPRWSYVPPAQQALVAQGQQQFLTVGCASCHNPDLGFSMGGSKGTKDSSSAYVVPGLLGIGNHAPYFHDGCASSLDQVLQGTCTAESLTPDPHKVPAELRTPLTAYLRQL